MSNHVALSTADHRSLRIKTERSVALGDAMMSCFTFPAEFRKIQNHYPILFQLNAERDAFTILALLGFENGENLFLENDGWDARYRPLAIDIQPFLIGMPRQSGGEKQVHIDMDSPRISEEDGIRVFDDEGHATDFLEAISEKLLALDSGYQASPDYLRFLQKHELLEPFVLEIELKDGSKNRLVGFHTINEDRLAALDGDVLEEMNRSDFLLPTFMVLASLSNFGSMIDRKNGLLPDG